MIASVDEGFSYLESFTNFERMTGKTRPWRLERMAALCTRTNHPEREFSAFHIAGSKGKGSTATFLAALVQATGSSPGLYTSPHLENYRERITLAGSFFNDTNYLTGLRWIEGVVESIKAEGKSGDDLPSTFELLTLLAFRLFSGLDWAVLETGLGGRLDATNVVTPRCTLITPIELEHTEYLGETIPEIAGEKAGIIKADIPVLTAPMRPEARAVIHRRAKGVGATHLPYEEAIEEYAIRLSRRGTEVEAKVLGVDTAFRLPVIGARQARNALLATAAALHIFPELLPEQIETALSRVSLPGRMELFPGSSGSTPIILDGAHTPDSVAFLRESVGELFPPPWLLIFGTLRGKNTEAMAEELIPALGEVVIARPASFRSSDLSANAAPFRAAGIPTTILEEPEYAVEQAEADRKSVV